MVDPVRPGAVPPRERDTNDRIARLEAQVRELLARDMTRATVGQGGTFRGFYDNGQLAFTFGKDIDDGIRKVRMNYASNGKAAFQVGPGNPAVNEAEQLRLNDQTGARMFATDGLAGFGLAEPSFQHLLVPIYGLNWVAGVDQVGASAQSFFYNAALWSQIQVRNYSGVTAMAGRLRVTNGDGEFVESSTTAAAGANTTLRRMVLLTPAFINKQNCKAEWILTPTGSGTADVWPRMCKGVTLSYYNINAGDQ
jgi:hypothetical protein